MRECLADLLIDAAARHGERLAVRDDAGSATWREVHDRAQAGAASLIAAGVPARARVAIQLPNGSDWLVAYWGAILAGCVAVPLNVHNRPAEVAYMLDRCGAAVLVAADGAEAPPDGAAMVVGPGELASPAASRAGGDAQRAAARRAGVEPGDVCQIQFTSGSTGYPKGAMLTHGGLLAAARSKLGVWPLGPGEAVLVPSPFSHILGYTTGCSVPALTGATVLTMSAFRAERALQLIADHRAVAMTGTPSHYLMLVEHPDRPRYDVGSLRFLVCGGSAITPETAERIRTDLGVSALVGGLGLSEAAGGVTAILVDDPPEAQVETLGRLLDMLEGRIVEPDSGRDVAPGEAGELWVRGPCVMAGYWGDPEQTARVLLPGGWLRTGDLVRRDGEGRLRFAGRLKELFTVGGYNVAPAEVERALGQHPAVAEAAVVGIPHRTMGEVPFAFVRLRPGTAAKPEELTAFAGERLAPYKVPRSFAFVDAFPVSGSGKVEKFKLREEALRRTGLGPLAT